MDGLGWLTLFVFCGAAVVAIIALIVWLITMVREKDPHRSRRTTLIAAGIALAALLLNALR